MDALRRKGSGGPVRAAVASRANVSAKAQAPVRRHDSVEVSARGPITQLLSKSIAKLMPHEFEPLIGPPAGKPIKSGGTLIGLGNDIVDPRASYTQNLEALKERGVPRFPLLTPVERRHETAFADDVEQHLEHFVEAAELLAKDDDLGTMVFEPDALKRAYAPWGAGDEPALPSERRVRAEANHALHPAATAVARLAFLKRLDALAKLPAGDPQRTVFATAGGCAAGKSDMDEAVKRQYGGFPFGAMWDSAGEGDALESAWVLEAAQARGLKVVFAFAANDAAEQYPHVLDRGQRTGRFVDVVTFANSYVEGTRNMRAFLASPQYQRAHERGEASAISMYMGPYDKRAEKDHARQHYPDAKLLGEGGLVEAADLPSVAATPELIASALETLEATVRAVRAQGGDADGMLLAALGNAEKFARAGVLEKA